jgi:hypothetical protein
MLSNIRAATGATTESVGSRSAAGRIRGILTPWEFDEPFAPGAVSEPQKGHLAGLPANVAALSNAWLQY